MNTGSAETAPRSLVLGRDIVTARSADRLAAFVAECVDTGVARNVLLVRLSRLPRALARPHHIRLVRDALEPLASANRAQAFQLPGGDIAIAWRGGEEAALSRSRVVLDRLFEGTGIEEAAALLAVLRLPEDARALLAEIERAVEGDAAMTLTGGVPLDPQGLVRLEQTLAQADIARFARRERVRAAEEGGFRVAWERRFLAAADITASLIPGVDPRGDPWLFARLTRTFDRRLLALLAAPGELQGAGPFSLELNVASVLGPEFMRFDAALPRKLRGHVVIDLTLPDIMADLAAFGFAREFASGRGYRLGLRGVGVELAAAFPAGQLGFDFIHMRWSDAWLASPPDLGSLAPAELVLSGVDTPAAMDWVGAHAVRLFEGAQA